MAMDPSKLRDEVLRRPLEARARLVDELLHSLEDDDQIDQAEHDAAWGSEIAERLRAVDACSTARLCCCTIGLLPGPPDFAGLAQFT